MQDAVELLTSHPAVGKAVIVLLITMVKFGGVRKGEVDGYITFDHSTVVDKHLCTRLAKNDRFTAALVACGMRFSAEGITCLDDLAPEDSISVQAIYVFNGIAEGANGGAGRMPLVFWEYRTRPSGVRYVPGGVQGGSRCCGA